MTFDSSRNRLAFASVVCAVAVGLLVVPRPETPDAVPYPPVDWPLARQAATQAEQRASQARTHPLAVDIRGVGERIRRSGALEYDGKAELLLQERAILRHVVGELVQAGRLEELLQLRELQLQLLHDALVARLAPGDNLELHELGGRLDKHIEGAADLVADDEYGKLTLRALFVQRWAQLCALEQHPQFRPTANDWRLVQRFQVVRLLRRPAGESGAALLKAIAGVARYSPQYPVDYARGIALYRMGAFGEALDAFERHLITHPQGRWTLRAQNFRLGAARALVE